MFYLIPLFEIENVFINYRVNQFHDLPNCCHCNDDPIKCSWNIGKTRVIALATKFPLILATIFLKVDEFYHFNVVSETGKDKT